MVKSIQKTVRCTYFKIFHIWQQPNPVVHYSRHVVKFELNEVQPEHWIYVIKKKIKIKNTGETGNRLLTGTGWVQPVCLPVIQAIQAASVGFTTTSYEAKWLGFQHWCEERSLDFLSRTVRSVLSFLQCLVDKGLVHATIQVYAVAFSSCHKGLGDSFSATSCWRSSFKGLRDDSDNCCWYLRP